MINNAFSHVVLFIFPKGCPVYSPIARSAKFKGTLRISLMNIA